MPGPGFRRRNDAVAQLAVPNEIDLVRCEFWLWKSDCSEFSHGASVDLNGSTMPFPDDRCNSHSG